MLITFTKITSIFSDFIKDPEIDIENSNDVERLVYLIIKTNKTLWDLEDSARLSELGDQHVAEIKKNIDVYNQQRNDLIREIDTTLHGLLNVSRKPQTFFHSESPGMIIDRLSIIFIKLSVVTKIISLIKEEDLKLEYQDKEKILREQIENLGNFFDRYMEGVANGEVFFEIQQPIKIYNDSRIRKYIKALE